MTKVCILIGEGPSERHFIPSLLENKFGFSPIEDKVPHLFEKDGGLFCFLPFPPMTTIPTGGKSRLRKTDTYRTVNSIVRNKNYLFHEPVKFYYNILVDHVFTDAPGQKIKRMAIEKALRNSGVPFENCVVHIVENELESWYIAGLTEAFPHINNSKSPSVKTMLSKEPERISNPKKAISDILNDNAQGTIKTARVMGEHFDVDKARNVSRSFNSFLQELENDGFI